MCSLRPLTGHCTTERCRRAGKIKIKSKPIRFVNLGKTYQPLETVVREQSRPTRPPTEPVAIPKWERAAEAAGEVGAWPDAPIIIIRFHHSTTVSI